MADPQSRPAVIIVSAHVVRPSPLFTKQNKFQAKTMFATGEAVGLAEWIIDDTCLILFLVDASGLKRPDQVRDSQEKVVQSLQQYTTANYPDMTSKFGELLLRIPELQRVCQVSSL